MTYFVTGGSRGIGEAIVLRALTEGHDVAFTYKKDAARAQQVVQQAALVAPERRCRAYQLDVRDAVEVEGVADRVLQEFGDVHVVVCSAGVNRQNLVLAMTDDEWREVLDTNLTGAFYVCRQFLPALLANRFGRLILISSIAQGGATGQANYAASKAGLVGLSGTLAREYGRKGVTSNVVVPGFIDTDMTRADVTEQGREFWKKMCPASRIGTPDEVAQLVAFLASDAAAFINGQTMGIDGGLDRLP